MSTLALQCMDHIQGVPFEKRLEAGYERKEKSKNKKKGGGEGDLF